MNPSNYQKPLAYNPRDIMPKLTVKQTTIAKDTMIVIGLI